MDPEKDRQMNLVLQHRPHERPRKNVRKYFFFNYQGLSVTRCSYYWIFHTLLINIEVCVCYRDRKNNYKGKTQRFEIQRLGVV